MKYCHIRSGNCDSYKITTLQLAYSVQTLDKGIICVLGRKEQKASHPQNGSQLKMYELFISGAFHFIFFDHNILEMTKSAEGETACEEKQL